MTRAGRSPNHRRPRLLFLLPHVPGLQASSGGARSTAHLIAGLARRHEVAVLCLRRPHDSPADDALRRACAIYREIETVAPTTATSVVRRVRRRLEPLTGPPGWVRASNVPAFRECLRLTVPEWQPDVVHVAYHVMGQYGRDLAGTMAPVVLTMYEPGTAAAADAAHERRGLHGLRSRLEMAAWARYERRVLRRMDAVVVLTERDRRALARMVGAAGLVRIPLGVTIPPRPLDPIGTSPPQVAFVGNFGHPPNVQAALWLAWSIFPLVHRARPDARLFIIGSGDTDEIRALAGGPITVTGAVESVLPFLDAAAVVVAPLQRGGGMRVKVMEALAAGKALVASHRAVEGLGVRDGHEVSLADESEEFASAIVRLLDDPGKRAALARRARAWASEHLGWEHSVAAYERLHDTLLSTRATVAAPQSATAATEVPRTC